MIKSIVIDFIILEKLNLSIKDFLYLNWINNPKEFNELSHILLGHDTSNLDEKHFIKLNANELPELRQSAIDLIQYLSIDSFKEFNTPKIIKKSSKKIKAEVLERVDEFRGKWAGLKAGSMGDKSACITKLSRWMETNPEYSFDQIIRAVDLYLDTEGRNLTYLQRADYFIYKQENNREESSRLSTFIDEVNSPIEKDWTSTLN